ncbi:uncharacterized protein LOC109721263 isoform X1 [Ananas comosus]|uniref:Uncharacterized protein LOC109721263 isoform X1 n=1 Tax=Ananas comosus TaxID=4615 RepID=A0A6P5G984_ANACO|nr:uncharacterized protein LOC109721263 isoform X1 [Ananas comosus]XP_020104362.1 uncharacterized protein LOC109721263 isoform X1 [Ananas comosus]
MDHNNATVRRITAVLLLFLVVSLLLSLPLVRGDEHGQRDRDVERREHMEVVEAKQQPDPAERAIGITGFMNRWDAVKAWAKLASMNFRPPESWYRRGTSSGEVVKDAAARSFESGKETVEQAAASAAHAAGETMHKTKEKVKRTVSASAGQELDAEL